VSLRRKAIDVGRLLSSTTCGGCGDAVVVVLLRFLLLRRFRLLVAVVVVVVVASGLVDEAVAVEVLTVRRVRLCLRGRVEALPDASSESAPAPTSSGSTAAAELEVRRRRRRVWVGAAQAADEAEWGSLVPAPADEALTASEARKRWTWCMEPASASRADASVGMDVSGTCSCPPITTCCGGGDPGGLAVVVVVEVEASIIGQGSAGVVWWCAVGEVLLVARSGRCQ
jgi:hypothetical protein